VKPGITGLAQNLARLHRRDFRRAARIGKLAETLQNPWHLEETKGLARRRTCGIKLLYGSRVHGPSLERFDTFLRTELGIIFKTPLV